MLLIQINYSVFFVTSVKSIPLGVWNKIHGRLAIEKDKVFFLNNTYKK